MAELVDTPLTVRKEVPLFVDKTKVTKPLGKDAVVQALNPEMQAPDEPEGEKES